MAMRTEPLLNTPLSPSVPEDVYFSDGQNAWILSRHQDVLAALKSVHLDQAGPPKSSSDRAKPIRNNVSSEAAKALSKASLARWEGDIKGTAAELLNQLSAEHSVDLVSEFIRPWCLDSAIALTGADPLHGKRLAFLVSRLFESDAAPHDEAAQSGGRQANQELDRWFPPSIVPFGKSLFLGIAQTTPAFLASAWAALLLHRSAWNALHARSESVFVAVEELLRYAGPVHSLFRTALKNTTISATPIAAGDRLILRPAAANRDPRRFEQPGLLDIERRATGHLALSAGSHYCMGASLVRSMTATATQALLARCQEPELSDPIQWSCGTMLIWASSLRVILDGTSV